MGAINQFGPHKPIAAAEEASDDETQAHVGALLDAAVRMGAACGGDAVIATLLSLVELIEGLRPAGTAPPPGPVVSWTPEEWAAASPAAIKEILVSGATLVMSRGP